MGCVLYANLQLYDPKSSKNVHLLPKRAEAGEP